jgi:hypothetical protein
MYVFSVCVVDSKGRVFIHEGISNPETSEASEKKSLDEVAKMVIEVIKGKEIIMFGGYFGLNLLNIDPEKEGITVRNLANSSVLKKFRDIFSTSMDQFNKIVQFHFKGQSVPAELPVEAHILFQIWK